VKRVTSRNCRPAAVKDIPIREPGLFRSELIEACSAGERIISCFGLSENGGVRIIAVTARDEFSSIHLSSTLVFNGASYESCAADIPAMHIYEREIYEQFGILPLNHPWLKPVRYPHDRADKNAVMENYPFYTMEGEQLHEVGVGPVHAGVIEPGHFRFMCDGETVHHLEIQLGYQHRGVSSLMLQGDIRSKSTLAESLCGDTAIGHTSAYAQALEYLAGADISRRAAAIRAIALELERIGIHLGDLSALAGDIAYLSGNAVFGALRTYVINTSQALCGNRFGRGLIRPGGVLFDIDAALNEQIHATLRDVAVRTDDMANALFADPGVLARFEKTGTVDTATARSIGMTGPAARASMIRSDVRADHPYGMYNFYPVFPRIMNSGDVFARAYVRYLEIQQSIDLILEILDSLPDDDGLMIPVETFQPGMIVVSMCEGWRGEIVHAVMTGDNGSIRRYYIKDPSLHNWMGLALAVRGNGISDFPVCNKSFNLSYCGNDL